MRNLRIANCELRICRGILIALAVLVLCAPADAAARKPTPTPTPRLPRLTGGFGRTQEPSAEVTPTTESLGETVRAVRERTRKEKATVAITNRNLVTDPKKGRLTTASPPKVEGSPAPAPTAAPPDARAAAGSEAAADPAGEYFWRGQMRSARERVLRWKDRVEEFETQSKKLENDFYTWDDGQYRDSVIKPAWDRKREELETARRELERAEKELEDLPEKARKAGALPGWLRDQ